MFSVVCGGDYSPCGPNLGCGCPLTCVADVIPLDPASANAFCERSCTQDSDCPLLETSCQGGLCKHDFCFAYPILPDAGPPGSPGGTLWGSCGDAGTYTCLPYGSAQEVGLCYQSADGGGSSSCIGADELCGPGMFCQNAVTAECQPVCAYPVSTPGPRCAAGSCGYSNFFGASLTIVDSSVGTCR